ncbi:MAG: ABC transporter ATP-binding protein [Chitinispirillaceae bacterium]|nr:ABC transporter ATP-binding protein [Chitinispirillaceae bacterium]
MNQESGVNANTIEAHDLTKRFGSFVAVEGISFSVTRGEIFGFLGANGAGKTTAIRMLCGLLEPTSGSGKVAGFDIMRQAARIRSAIGYMSQKFSLYPDLTVKNNLFLFGSIYGLTGRTLASRIDETTQFLDMKELLPRLTGSLPWGWQQRLSLACANLHEPQVLFLDEPTGSVDPLSRRTFWDFIDTLSRRGTTIFVTTHHMDEAEYCHRISIMVAGRIAAIDSPATLKSSQNAATLQEAFVKIVTAPTAQEAA